MTDDSNVQIARLDERVKALDRKLEENFQVVLGEFKDLRENFANRLDRLETQKFSSTDFIQFRNNEIVPMIKTVGELMQFRWILAGVVTLAIFLAPFLWQIINKKWS